MPASRWPGIVVNRYAALSCALRGAFGQNGRMAHMPTLRVVPLAKIRAHERVDPLRVERLTGRFEEEGIQVNPMMCTEAPGGELVLLDGATRTAALRSLGLEYAVVQLVDPEDVVLETWHHVVRECEADDFLSSITNTPELELAEDQWTPRLRMVDGSVHSVVGKDVSLNAALAALVDSYVGLRSVSRITDPNDNSVPWRFPNWVAVIEYPTLTVEDVMKAAVEVDLLPAGITRFLVPERALRLNLDLDLLTAPDDIADKQAALESLLSNRARSGRIRRYEETVVILDD